MFWKKKEEKKEEVKEVDLLEELCGGDAKLHDFCSSYLFVDPLSAVSPKSLDILTEEGRKSGAFRLAVDKAIFEGSQKPGERAKYIKIIQNLALKAINSMEQEREKLKKQGLTDQIVFLEKRIEKQEFMNERTEDILNVATKFYDERLVVLGENERREAEKQDKKEELTAEERKEAIGEARGKAEREEQRIKEREKKEREARKKARGGN